MTFTITLLPGSHQFVAATDTSLLQAALDAQLVIPYGCRDGACGSCKATIKSGQIDHGRSPESTLTLAERAQGLALLCCAQARADLTIECRDVRSASDIPLRKLPCRVQSLTKVADDIMLLTLNLPANDTFRFVAGQYVDFLLLGGKRRSFSIANAPGAGNTIELHVRLVPDGEFTGHVFNKMKERDILRLEGPLGGFYLRDAAKPIVFLAGGTGFAPIKSIIEDCIAKATDPTELRPMTLYFGARNLAGLYAHQQALAWAATLPNFNYVPVISDDIPSDWAGRTGLAHLAVMQDWPDLSAAQVYACGAPAMIDAARQAFTGQCQLPVDDFFADAFTFAADKA